ncbi:MAG TPA: AAA family ATPase [Terriglobales bacterium]
MKRRKKKTEEPRPESAEAPLQPAYFENESVQPPSSAPELSEQSSMAHSEPVEQAEVPASAEQPQPTRSGNNNQRRGRRRRGRTNRGRGPVRNAAAAQAAQQSSVEGTGEQEAVKPVTSMPRAPKGVVVLAIGLPGSGKSSWFKRHNITPLSSDMLRALLFDDPTEQRFQDLIFSNLRSMLKARLIAQRPTNYVDTTNLTPHDRHSWIKLAKDFGFDAQAVFFDVPLEVCLERNQKRDRVVPEEIMRRFAEKLKTPTFEEGFSKITVVRVKQKEASAS